MFQEQVNKMLADDARALAAICRKEVIPLSPQKDKQVRQEMQEFLALSEQAKKDMLKAADDIFYGVDSAKDIIDLATHAKAGTLNIDGYKGQKVDILLGAVQMLKGSSAVSNFILNKTAFWGETQGLFPQYQMTMTNAATFAQEGSYDTGYLLAFNGTDGRGAKVVNLEDLIWNLKYFKLNETEKVPVSGGAANTRTAIFPDRYGAGKLVSTWFEGATYGTTTAEVNMQIRMSSAAGKSKAAYQVLLRKPTLAKNQWKIETLNSDSISNIIMNLNKRIQYMLNEARTAETPLLLAPNTPILVYYHPDYMGTVKLIQNRSTSNILATTSAPDLINLDYNVVFVPTFEAAKSGAWKATGTTDDEHFEIMEEAGSKEFGVKIIIPKQRNHFIVFQDLFPDANTNREEFARNYVWEERYTPYLSEIQEGWLYTKL